MFERNIPIECTNTLACMFEQHLSNAYPNERGSLVSLLYRYCVTANWGSANTRRKKWRRRDVLTRSHWHKQRCFSNLSNSSYTAILTQYMHSREFRYMRPSPIIISVIKLRRMRLAGLLVRLGR